MGPLREKAGAEMLSELFVLVFTAEDAGEIFHMSLCVWCGVGFF